MKMLSNWKELHSYDQQIRQNWGHRSDGILNLEQIQQEADAMVQRSKNTGVQAEELRQHARHMPTVSGWSWESKQEVEQEHISTAASSCGGDSDKQELDTCTHLDVF